jgi:hypothetical protein
MSMNKTTRITSGNTIFQSLVGRDGYYGTNWPTEVVEIARLCEFDENDRFFTFRLFFYTFYLKKHRKDGF